MPGVTKPSESKSSVLRETWKARKPTDTTDGPRTTVTREVQYEKALYGQKPKGLEANVIYSDILGFPCPHLPSSAPAVLPLTASLHHHDI